MTEKVFTKMIKKDSRNYTKRLEIVAVLLR